MSNLFINDLFWTVQGEGAHAGRAALFVRMPYCNLACSWCDTTFDTYQKIPEADFELVALLKPAKFAVITGGEPTMHRHTPRVIEILKKLGFEIAIETNGSFPIPKGVDFVTCSPKRDAEYFIHPEAYNCVSEFKYIVDADFDFSILDKHKSDCIARHSLSPEFGNMQTSVEKIITYISENPQWRLSLQTHKWINIK